MTENSMLDIAQIESKIATYEKFLSSAKEINQQIFHQNNLTSSQSLFSEILSEFNNFTKSNRNPNFNEEVVSRISNYIENLDQIEREIRLEQEKRLTSSSSEKISDVFHHGNSISSILEPEDRFKISPDAPMNAEEIHLKADYLTTHKKTAHLNSNASTLFSILNSVIAKNDCPDFVEKKDTTKEEEMQGKFFEITIHDKLKHNVRKIKIGKLKEGGFAIFTQNPNQVFVEVADPEISDRLLSKILKAIYLNASTRQIVMHVDLYKIANGFYIDETGKIISYSQNKQNLSTILPSEFSTHDLQIIEDEVNLDSIYKLLTDSKYSQLVQSSILPNGQKITMPKSFDGSRDRFALVNNQGLIQIYQKIPPNDFAIAQNSKQVIDFAKNLESDIKDTLIFTSFSAALKGNWKLLDKISIDPRITKQSIIDHIKTYLSSSFNDPFDINFLARAATNVPSLSYHISKLIIENRTHFLSQIIYGQLEPDPCSQSFAVKLFARHPNFLEPEDQNDQLHLHHIKESFGFITHAIINSKGIDFDHHKFINEDDYFMAYTNCLSKYSRNLLSCQPSDFAKLSAVIYRSFTKLIECASRPLSLESNSYLIFPLISKTLASFSHQPSLSSAMHRLMIDALVDAKIDRNSKIFTSLALKICASLSKARELTKDHQRIFDRLIIACTHNPRLLNLVKITHNQIVSANDSAQNREISFQKFSPLQRIEALSTLDFYEDHLDHHPDLSASKVSSIMPVYLTYDEMQIFTRNSRRELNLLNCDLTTTSRRTKIAKKIRTLENKYQQTKPDLVNLSQTFVDFDRSITKTIIRDANGNILYKIGDSLYNFIAAPIKHFFADDPIMLDFLLDQIKDLDVAALDHGINLNSEEDLSALTRLKPRLRQAIRKVANHIYHQNPNHPYLTFLKGFNQSSEGEMLFDVQSFLEDRFPNDFICNSANETLTIKLLPNTVQYQSNCNIEISKQDLARSKPLATMQATGLINIDYKNNAKITNNSFIHGFKNNNLDLKVSDEFQKFIAFNANCHQFDEVFHDMITNPVIASGFSSLFLDAKSDYHLISLHENEEQIYIPRNKQNGFVFTVNRNSNRTIESVILHRGLYQYDSNNDSYHEISDELTPANLKELSIRLEHVTKLCQSINKNSRPLRDAFCELKSTKFNKKSNIGDLRSSAFYKFKFRAIGKLKSGKKLYLDENGRLLINSSLTSVKLEPITHPGAHMVEKLPIEKVSPTFDLEFKAQYFDHRRKAFHRYPSTFKVKVRQIGSYTDAKNNQITIYHDNQGRRFKSVKGSKNLQEILDLTNDEQSQDVQQIIQSFKERSTIHEIFDSKKPQALIEKSAEVTIGKIQHLTTSDKSQKPIPVRQITSKTCAKSPQKSFHIDRFGVIYTKNKRGTLQKHDLNDLDQNSKNIVLRSLDLSYDNLRLEKIYQLLEKNNSDQKTAINLKPYDATHAHIFVKNGAKYALFKDKSNDHHLMRLTYEKGVKNSKTGIIYDPDEIKLITSSLERKAIFDDLVPATYLVRGNANLQITEEKFQDLSIKSFKLSGLDPEIDKKDDKIIAIDSNLRILHKKPQEKNYHIATFSESKKIMPHFYDCIEKTLVKLENWKNHYTNLMKEREGKMQNITSKDLHQSTKKQIKTSTKTPSTTISNISISQLHTHDEIHSI